ncbi:MAG: hypothetical protein IPP17_11420 [Bacteroidetes bacterium]|nr:hypothetical protein [Bacteroidota bacterium]
MKNALTSILFLGLLTLFFSSCGGPIESMSFKSPEGDRSIDVSGKRESPAGPIIVTVKLIVPAGDKSFSFEHQAQSLTKESVTATWPNNNSCNLSFKLDDGTSWEVEAYLFDDKVEAIKKFKIDGKAIFN